MRVRLLVGGAILTAATVSVIWMMSPSISPAAESSENTSIAWYGTWQGGLAAAKKTGRPILLISAAPHCHGTPGIW